MDKIKGFLKGLRDAVAFSFSWLTICVIIVSLLSGNKIVTVSFLIKLFLLCLWGSISFTLCFRNLGFEKKGFMFSLTAFYILFIPVEIVMFYLMEKGMNVARRTVAKYREALGIESSSQRKKLV